MMFPKEAAQPIMRFIDCGPQLEHQSGPSCEKPYNSIVGAARGPLLFSWKTDKNRGTQDIINKILPYKPKSVAFFEKTSYDKR